jgi:hypothetical protein
MRRCLKCGNLRSEFYKNGSGLQRYCKLCAKESAKLSYQTNKERVIERTKNQVERKKAFVSTLKNKPCVDCGRILPSWAMHFDHIQDKVEGLSRMATNNRTHEKILAEVDKCDLVCVLCHRDRTTRRTKYFISTPEYEELVQKWQKP